MEGTTVRGKDSADSVECGDIRDDWKIGGVDPQRIPDS